MLWTVNITLISILTGCNNSDSPSGKVATRTPATPLESSETVPALLEILRSKIHTTSTGVQNALDSNGETLQEITREEVDKLFRWEYKVSDLSIGATPEALENALNALGEDGWECFHLQPANSRLRATCRRHPKSAVAYLKLLPGL